MTAKTSTKLLSIIGAGGFGQEVQAWTGGVLVGPEDAVVTAEAVLAIGDSYARFREWRRRKREVKEWSMLWHPTAHYETKLVIGEGCIVCSGVQMTTDIQIGEHCIVNLNATIGHGVRIGYFVSIMPGAHISGNVTLEDKCYIGTGAVILPGLTVGHGATVGAGAVVSRSVPPLETWVGVPARRLK